MPRSPTSTTNANNGFTLVEMVVALAISALVMIGVYTIFETTISVRTTIMNRENMALITARLSGLMNSDLRQRTLADIQLSSTPEGDELRFVTHNSILLNRAVPVTVSWYVEDGYLVRREENFDMDLDVAMKMLPRAKDFVVEFFTGSDYEARTVPDARLLRISLNVDDKPYRIILGQTVEPDPGV